jgi:MscS family membrane protein
MNLAQYLPPALIATGPRGLPWWQWLALPVVGLVALLLGILLGRLTVLLLRLITHRTKVSWDDRILDAVGGPISLLWAILGAFAALGELGLPLRTLGVLNRGLRTGALLAFFWMLLRLVSIAGESAETSSWARSRPSMRAIVPLGVRVGYFAVLAIALVAVLADLGYPVASLVAGLGIGGLALALAAQKTVENLFGAFSIGVDQPFSVGDVIAVDGISGEVQAIGLRSTRIRTPERTLISIPNGKLADMKIESHTARDRFRLFCVLGLVYSTTSAQLRRLLADLESTLRAQPKVYQDDVGIRLRALGADALEVEVAAYVLTTDFKEFATIRQEMLLAFMELVEQAGTALAYPTRTVHVAERTALPASTSAGTRAAV